MTPQEMRAEADRLVALQREERGYRRGKTLDGKPCLIIDPYKASSESEARAARIVILRRTAAALEANTR